MPENALKKTTELSVIKICPYTVMLISGAPKKLRERQLCIGLV
jgi:hypothetical protein